MSGGKAVLRILGDRTTVEVFVGEGRCVRTHQAFGLPGDDRLALCFSGGPALFEDLTIREYQPR